MSDRERYKSYPKIAQGDEGKKKGLSSKNGKTGGKYF